MPKVSKEVRSRIWSLETQIGKGILDGTHDPEKYADILQNFLEKGERTVTLALANNILGMNKVISNWQAARTAWLIEKIPDCDIYYHEETLRQCAEENAQGKADWRLVYCHGLSLREQREKRGTDRNKQPCFNKESNWWLESKEDGWATYKPQAGYYLINFRDQFGSLNWNQQEQEISKLGKEYERCHEAIFSEAIFTIFMVNGERIAEDWYHWGVSLVSSGGRVRIGYFRAYGLGVDRGWYGYSYLGLRVALVRKFDH